MSEVLTNDEPEPPSPRVDILEGLPPRRILTPAEAKVFRSRIEPYVGKWVVGLATDAFIVTSPDEATLDWRQVNAKGHLFRGSLIDYGQPLVLYRRDGYMREAVVPGILVGGREDCYPQKFIAAEDLVELYHQPLPPIYTGGDYTAIGALMAGSGS